MAGKIYEPSNILDATADSANNVQIDSSAFDDLQNTIADPINNVLIQGEDIADVLIGTEADRPSAGTNNRLYIVTDKGRIDRDNGSSWDIISTTNSGDLDNDSVTVAGNTVALGGSTTVDYVDLNDTGSSFPIPNADLANDSVTVAGNSVALGSSTGIAYVDLSDTGASFPIPNTDLANSDVTVAGNSVSLGGSTGVAYVALSDTGASFPIPNTDLANDSVTVAGNSVSLGSSTTIDYVDLNDTGVSFPIPNSDLANSSVTVAGNSVSLGSSTTVDYVDLNDTGASFPIPNADLTNSTITVAGNAVSLGGSTTIAHGDLSDSPTNAHHNEDHDHAGDTINPDAIENTDYNETVNALGSISGATDIDITSGNQVTATLTADVTFSFTNPSSTPDGNSFVLVVNQDGTGGHAITWPGSVEWDGGFAPSLTTDANNKAVLSFFSPDGGTTWIGLVSADEVA